MQTGKERAIIYGTGSTGQKAYEVYADKYEFIAFCSTGAGQNEILLGLPVLAPQNIKNYPDTKILIASMFSAEIVRTLNALSIYNYVDVFSEISLSWMNISQYFSINILEHNKNRISFVRNLLSDMASKEIFDGIILYRKTGDLSHVKGSEFPQYNHPKIKYIDNMVIVEGGAYDGETIRALQKCTSHTLQIHAFEPDKRNFQVLADKFKTDKNVNLYNCALSNKNAEMHFDLSEIASQSRLSSKSRESRESRERERERVTVVSLDDMASALEGRVDGIILDIEGAEYDAIVGAVDIIRKSRPYMAICVYHYPEDLWNIPLLLASLCRNYSFYLGHHSGSIIETVFYCIPDD